MVQHKLCSEHVWKENKTRVTGVQDHHSQFSILTSNFMPALKMFSNFWTIFFIVFGLQAVFGQRRPAYDYDDDCGCPCDRDDSDDPCWANCDDDDGCGGLLASLGLGNTLGNVGDTLDNTLGGLGRKKRETSGDVSLDDVVAIADILSRRKREIQRNPAGFEPNM